MSSVGVLRSLSVAIIALVGTRSTAAAQGTVDRTKPPELGPPHAVSLPPIVTRQLANGLKLLIVEQHELPLQPNGFHATRGHYHPEEPRYRGSSGFPRNQSGADK